MDDFNFARTLHILAVVMWIGGVGFVTTTVMPAIRASHAPAERLHAFHKFERRFVWQARFWVLLAGVSGFWMTMRADLWARFRDVSIWWMHAMVLVWLIFFVMLFIVEPMVLHRRMKSSPTPARDFDRMEGMHRVLLVLSLIAVLAAASGSHGLL